MYSFAELVPLFDNHFQSISQALSTRRPENLYEPCHYFLRLGGKRIRPVACLMANELLGPMHADAWHAATAIELFHNFTLIHDDIMDKAPLRRGQPTIHEKYSLPVGILSGDALCILAYQELGKIVQPNGRILQLFNQTALEVCEGQQMDMDFEQKAQVLIADYLKMITLKTSVLLAAGLKMGAWLGGATDESAAHLYEFGKNMGIAFQLQDDYLDAFGNAEKTGKQQGGDILANKKTYLLLSALAHADAHQKARMQTLLSHTGPGKIPAMLQCFQETSADLRCREAVSFYSQKAFDNLEKAAAPSSRKIPLQALASFLLEREY
jgi:geranylgeranyl diphosphate synthase type II